MSSNNTINLPFLNGIRIHVTKLPKYVEFKQTFTAKYDKGFAHCLLTQPDDVIHPEQKQKFLKVFNKIKPDGTLVINYHQKHDIGRFYGNGDINLTPQCRTIKHTMYEKLGWLDLDFKKCHPTIAVLVGKANNITLDTIEDYVRDPDTFLETLCDYYNHYDNDVLGGEINDENQRPALTIDQVKYLFSILLFGGGFKSWVEEITKGDTQYKPVKLKNIDGYELFEHRPHAYITGFKKDCKELMDTIYKQNHAILNKVKGDLDPIADEYKLKCRVMSYFFQIIENHCLWISYKFLIENRVITVGNCELEYDGLCIPPIPAFVNKEELVLRLNSHIVEQTKMPLNIAFKAHDKTKVLYNVIDEYANNPVAFGEEVGIEAEVFCEAENDRTAADDNAAANIILRDLKERLFCDAKGRLFFKNENR